jgi:hypothetical protein
MSQKDLYLCLMIFKDDSDQLFKFMSAPIASSENQAKEASIAEALAEHPQYANYRVTECHTYSFRRSALEQVAREVLGWTPPNNPTTK